MQPLFDNLSLFQSQGSGGQVAFQDAFNGLTGIIAQPAEHGGGDTKGPFPSFDFAQGADADSQHLGHFLPGQFVYMSYV